MLNINIILLWLQYKLDKILNWFLVKSFRVRNKILIWSQHDLAFHVSEDLRKMALLIAGAGIIGHFVQERLDFNEMLMVTGTGFILEIIGLIVYPVDKTRNKDESPKKPENLEKGDK